MQKKWIFCRTPPITADRLAEVHLRMAGRMRQRHERLPPSRPADPHIVLHHRVAAGKAVLVAQPLEDPLRRMPLLHRRAPVRLQDRVDHRQQRTELRLLHRLRPRIARRQREPAHLRHRLAAQPENPRRLTPAIPLDEHEMPNRGVDLHREHPRPTPKGISLATGRILLRPHQHHRRRSSGLVLSPPCTPLLG